MFCIFRYLCVTVYIQLFSFRAASVFNKLSCQLVVIGKITDFQQISRRILGTVRDKAKVILITKRKWYMHFQLLQKSAALDDLELIEKVYLGGPESTCRTVLLVDQSSTDFFAKRSRNRCRSHVFPILDISIRSGDIRDQSLKLS